jgi:hypothetical protein
MRRVWTGGGREGGQIVRIRQGLDEQEGVESKYLVAQRYPADTLGIPEQLVDVVVPNDLLMVPLPPQKDTVDDFIPLIPKKPVERPDDGPQVQAFGNGLDPVLALRTTVIVVSTLEDET